MKRIEGFEFRQHKRASKVKKAPVVAAEAISPEDLIQGCAEFNRRERRAFVYKRVRFLIKNSWGNPKEVAEALGLLLLIWNNAFYRHGPFDCDALEKCIATNQPLLDGYRERSILAYTPKDDDEIKELFTHFLEALQIVEGESRGKKSPVGVAKALHLLAPFFFPLWDEKIAKAYKCYYDSNSAGKYILFIGLMNKIAQKLAPKEEAGREPTLLKRIDEYLYVRHTLPS